MREIKTVQELAERWEPLLEGLEFPYHRKWVTKDEMREIYRDNKEGADNHKSDEKVGNEL